MLLLQLEVEECHTHTPLDGFATKEARLVAVEEMQCLTIHYFFLNWMPISSSEVQQTIIQEITVLETVQKCNIIQSICMVSLETALYFIRIIIKFGDLKFVKCFKTNNVSIQLSIVVGSKNGANSGSDASPPLQSFTEESSPENITGSTPPLGIGRVRNCHSTESITSLSDDSGGHTHNKSSTSSRKVMTKIMPHEKNRKIIFIKINKLLINDLNILFLG